MANLRCRHGSYFRDVNAPTKAVFKYLEILKCGGKKKSKIAIYVMYSYYKSLEIGLWLFFS